MKTRDEKAEIQHVVVQRIQDRQDFLNCSGIKAVLFSRLGITLVVALFFSCTIFRFQYWRPLHRGATPTSGLSAPELSDLASQYVLVNENFPDPCFIESGGSFYAFATRNGSGINIQLATAPSDSIRNWTFHSTHDALPDPGPWTAKQLQDLAVWAPSVVEVNSTSFVLYYSALSASHPRRHCVGAAFSDRVLGPYAPLPEPLVCNFDSGGAIDPQYFHDPLTSKSYLLYKVDGNAIGTGGACGNTNMPNTPTPIMALPLDPDNITSVDWSGAFQVVTNQRWDGAYLENPMMWYHEFDQIDVDGFIGAYHLVFNAGCFTDSSYRIEHVVCLADPKYGVENCDWNGLRSGQDRFRRPYSKTLLHSGDTHAKIVAPGGPTVALRGSKGEVNQQFLGFHADVHVEWFNSGEPLVGGSRRRGFFIAELAYPATTGGLALGSLQKPDI